MSVCTDGAVGMTGEGIYSLAEAPEYYSDVEPGYATVGAPSHPRHRLPSPRSTPGTKHTPSPHPHSSTPGTKHTPPHPHSSTPGTKHTPSHPHSSTQDSASHPHSSRHVRTLPHSQASRRPTSKRILSTSDLPSVSSALSILSNSTSYGLSPPHTSHEQVLQTNTTSASPSVLPQNGRSKQRAKQRPSEKVYEQFYQEVFSPLSDQEGAKSTEGAEALYTKVKKPKKESATNREDIVNYSYVQHCQGCSAGDRVYHTLEPTTPQHSDGSPHSQPQSSKSARKKLFQDQPQMKHKSRSVDNLMRNSHHTQKQYTQQCVDCSYEDEHSFSSSFEITQESEDEIPQNYDTPILSNSLNLASHRRSPTIKPPHAHRKRRKSTGNIIDGPEIRAFPLAALQTAQVVHQPNLQGNVYVFSEQLPDGRLQYYSATPVQDVQSPRLHTLTSRPHTPNTMVSHNLTESGYFSNAIPPTSVAQKPSSGSVLMSSTNGGASTIITPIVDPTTTAQNTIINPPAESPILETVPQDIAPITSPARMRLKPPPNKYKHLLAQFESREIDIKARNSRLLALNNKLNMEISTLEKKVEDISEFIRQSLVCTCM